MGRAQRLIALCALRRACPGVRHVHGILRSGRGEGIVSRAAESDYGGALSQIILHLNAGLLLLSDRLLDANIGMIEVLGAAIAERDSDTSDHNWRVTYYAIRLAERLGRSCDDICELIKG